MLTALLIISAVAAPSGAAPSDWSGYPGPNRNSISTDPTPLADSWPKDGPPVLWSKDVEPGHGGASIDDGKVYLMDRVDGEKDTLNLFDLKTGKLIDRKEVSNTMETAFCLRALRRAFERRGRKPKVFNTDQGSQFTSPEWIKAIEDQNIKVSMDGKGRWMDKACAPRVFIERLWRSIKYEKLRLWPYETVQDVSGLAGEWMDLYNHRLEASPEPFFAALLMLISQGYSLVGF